MAEVLATMVVGPLLSMVKDKASSYLLDEYKVMEGMEEQHKLLKRKLPAILDVIADAEQQAAQHREGAKAWLEEVRTVAYKANDVLDEFKYEVLRRKAKAEGHYKALGMDVIKLFPSHNRVVFRCKMAKRLCMILREIDVLIAEMNAFRFKFKPQPPMPMKWRQTDACIPTDFVDIASKSRAQEKKDLVDRLLAGASSKDLMVLPIVGMGGLGKTTLAQLVYNDPTIQKHFELRLWVCVSNDFDVDSLAEKIVKGHGCEANGSSALEKLQNTVSGERYLLVLDDVWNRDEPSKWERLKSYLQHGGSGSSVLTTTRDEVVAKLMMGRSTTERAYKLGSLDEESLGKIIKSRAFASKQENEWPGELVNMVGEVSKRCSGSPLAATALGSVLGTKTSKKEWEDVLNGSTICDEENGILPVLKLSYNCLPSYMRQCFAFCAMFPKDYEMDMQMLIHLWMANGFIPELSKVCPETFGERIFNELKSRSFFQDLKSVPFVDKNYSIYREDSKHRYCSRITCKIHDLMHDVAQSAMGEECAAIIATHPSEREDVRSVRHLYLSIRRPENLLNASLEKGSPTFQTLICDGSVKEDMKILSKYNAIRALKIDQGSCLRPKYLHHLRYLDLSRSDIKVLPEDISILYLLQTLNLSYCCKLEQLPKGLKYLTALRHLYTHGCGELKSMPTELGCLTSLQVLTYFVAGTDSGSCNVRELQDLDDLGGTLELSKLENVTGLDAQAAGLGNKKKLTELELCWSWTDSDQEAQNNNHNEVLEGLKPHDGLKVLRINHCGSSTFPAWISTLSGMVELVLFGCKELKRLPALWQQLPALEILELRKLESFRCLCNGGTSVTFPKLKVLILEKLANFEAWWETREVQGEEPMFPKLEELQINCCESLTALPKAASVISRVDMKCRSAFPALRKMTLALLTMFERWEAGEEISGEEVTFPQLEELSILNCGRLSAVPKGSFVKQPFGGSETLCCRSAFPALRKMTLENLTLFGRWEAGEGISGEEVTFPQLDELSISGCGSLKALPKGSLLVKQSCGGAETVCYRTAFPALRKLELSFLSALEMWGAGEGTPAEEVTFPLLEELSISCCESLSALPQGGSAFPALKSLNLSDLSAFERWGAAEGTPGEEVTFSQLESLRICHCPRLTDLPEAPKLSELSIFGGPGEQQISLEAASRFIPSLTSLGLHVSHDETETTLLRVKKKWNGTLALPAMSLSRCDLFFSSHSSALDLWTCFTQLVELEILDCDVLEYWPENVFQVLECLRKLSIYRCSKLTGRTQASDDQSAPERGGLLPCLESLEIHDCTSLVEVPNLPASLKTLYIVRCDKTKSIVFDQQKDTRLVSGEGVVQLKLIPGCSSSDATTSTAVLKLSSAANHRFLPFPCLESLIIWRCHGLSEVSNLPPSIKTLNIYGCGNLQSLSGHLDAVQELTIVNCSRLESLETCLGDLRSLEELRLRKCKGLVSLPDEPQAYSSLRVLLIQHCDGIKLLPSSLQTRLDYLDWTDLDAHLTGPHLPEPKTQKYAIRSLVCLK